MSTHELPPDEEVCTWCNSPTDDDGNPADTRDTVHGWVFLHQQCLDRWAEEDHL